DVLESSQSSLWWAGKELETGKTLSDYTGKNEKTKIIVKLMASAQGAPVREPRVDEETHKAMLHYYYKKQEEQKALNNDDDDSYLSSEWANPKSLKVFGGSERKGGPNLRTEETVETPHRLEYGCLYDPIEHLAS
ncbi:hypothetical protein FOL47_001429, partial [Perkinsus chesapeaki]